MTAQNMQIIIATLLAEQSRLEGKICPYDLPCQPGPWPFPRLFVDARSVICFFVSVFPTGAPATPISLLATDHRTRSSFVRTNEPAPSFSLGVQYPA
jgi:hypothetical protein